MSEVAPRRVAPVGRRALLVDCADLTEALGLAEALERDPLPGQVDVRIGARTVLVRCVDERSTTGAAPLLRDLAPDVGATRREGRTLEIAVVYDGEDLDDVARLTGRSRAAVVDGHCAQEWVAAFGGFAAGFVYLSGRGPAVPRRPTPRTRVPAGSVGLADRFSAVYPRSSPGGWQLLGRTTVALWDVERDPPSLVRPGDRVRFRAVRDTALGAGPAVRAPTGPPARGPETSGGDGTRRRASGSAPDVPGFVVVRPGPLSLVEDLGRAGLEHLGVSPSGAADRGAAARANRLVGGPPGAPVLETLGGLELRAVGDQVCVVTGPPGAVTVHLGEGRRVAQEVGAPFSVPDGARVEVAEPSAGLRRYVAVRGGFAVRAVLGSTATDLLSGLGPEPLGPGVMLPVAPPEGAAVVGHPEPPGRWPDEPLELEVVLGPRSDWFTPQSVERLVRQEWRVTDHADRVGVRLQGAALERAADAASRELPSEPMVAGCVQVPPTGQPVVLLVDHPVTGGYPVVAVVVEPGLELLAQARPGQVVRFRVGEQVSAC
ncbi:MAG TPA: 5-oxoprolinase/urea amidolyase family protein [Actinotalea sp.]|nr:5-oxoprolinase/urea amidolyase family protein [Actinotalea sp.]